MSDWIGVWPLLSEIGLSPAALATRASCIGGSDANIIMSGDDAKVLNLWQQKRGEVESDDLSGILPVQMGCWTEALNRQWYTLQTGREVTHAGEAIRCSTYDWRTATLDGRVPALTAIWEAKHVSAFFKPEDIVARYMPQLQHNMAVAGVDMSVLSVFYGSHKWEAYEIGADWLYQAELLEAEQHFWAHVQDGEPPVALAPAALPIEAIREADMSASNSWASHAADWRANVAAAKKHEKATKELKALVEPDVARAFGHQIEIKRSKAGALTIKELSNAA